MDASVRAHDLFMAELSGVLSRGLRHVVAPPTAVWAQGGGGAHDMATPYADHVGGGCIYSMMYRPVHE